MATPSLAMIPSAYADSKVYSVLPNNGDGDFTFNRDSSATRVGPNGLIQTVGYFGSELVTNGDFATDSDWTKETGWTISGGTANFSGGTGNKAMYQAVGITNGKTYKIQYTVSSISAGQVAVRFGGMSGVDEITATTIGTYTGYITATGSANGNIQIEDNDNNFVGSIDNVSVKEVTDADFDFTRTSSATRVNPDYLIETSATNTPRLDYTNGTASILLEPQSTNLLPYSQDFSQGWINTGGSTITNNYGLAPDGTQTSTRIQGNSSVILYYPLNLPYDGARSMYIRAINGSGNIQVLSHNSNTDNVFKINTNWQRVEVTNAPLVPQNFYAIDMRGASTNIYDVEIWGAQYEDLSFATSYIPSLSGSTVTRAAETLNNAGNSDLINSTEGVLYVDFASLNNAGNYRLISLSDGTTSNRLFIGFRLNTGYIYYYVIAGGVSQSNFDTTITSANSFSKIALKYKANDFALWVNGVEIYADSSGSIASGLDTLQFADGNVTNRYFYGNCKDIRVYNEALTDAQLQTLTTL